MYGWHCALWIDHEHARIVFFDKVDSTSTEIHAAGGHKNGNTHHRAGVLGSGKVALDADFVRQIEQRLEQCHEFVVVGPGTAKLEFIRHVHRHAPQLDEKMTGVETLDQVTDHQLVEFARSYFRKYDRMHATNDQVLAGMAAHRQ